MGNAETMGVRKVKQTFTGSQNKSFIGIRVGQYGMPESEDSR